MSKINKKSKNYSLKILTILAFGLIFVPLNTTLAAYGANIGNYFANYQMEKENPVPFIGSISPNSGERGTGAKTITITGSNFVPGSVARVNGSNRVTTFIDHSHLLIQLTANDLYRNDNFFITVYNGAPGGGYSEAALFTLKNITVTNSNNNTGNNNYSNSSYSASSVKNNTYSTSNTNKTNENNNSGNLASSVILGSSGSFLPSGLVQWILFAIIILVIIILIRKVFSAEENYHASPMKHA